MSNDWMGGAASAVAAASPHIAVVVPVVKGRVLHVDGDIMAYWAGGKEDTPVSLSRQIAQTKFESMMYSAGAERMVLHLTAASSTKGDRFLISTVKPYQGHRKSGRKPKNWEFLRSWMTDYQGPLMRVKTWATREADDGLAYMAYLNPESCVIVTKDKDMRMLPGWHMNWDTQAMHFVPLGTYDLVANDLQYGHKWFWLQLLQGDTADNIPGLPAVGKKLCGEAAAKKLLEDCASSAEACSVVMDLYHDLYGDEFDDRMLEQALLLWLRGDKQAQFEDVYEVLPPSHFHGAMHRLRLRVKEKYDEAYKLTGISATHTDAG